MRRVLIVIAAGFALLGGCETDEEPPTATVTGPGGNEVALNGNWAAACLTVGSDSGKTLHSFGGSGVTKTENFYLNTTNCTDSPARISRETGTFDLGGTVDVTLPGDGSSGSVVTATKKDLTLTRSTLTLNDATLVDTYNSEGTFGFNDWEAGTSKDVLGVSEDGSSVTVEIERLIIYVDDGPDPDVLYLGTTDSGDVDADGYPTELDNSGEGKL